MNEDNERPRCDEFVELLAKDMYYLELERKDSLAAKRGLPVGIVSVMFSMVAIYLREIPVNTSLSLVIPFIVMLALAVVSLLVSVYYLARLLWGHNVELVPYAGQVAEYARKLTVYHEAVDASEPDQVAVTELRDYLCGQYVRDADINRRTNNQKVAFLNRANIWIVVCLLPIIASSVFFFIAKYVGEVENGNISITCQWSPGEKAVRGEGVVQMPDEKKNEKPQNTPKPPPKRPTPPPSETLREDHGPDTKK